MFDGVLTGSARVWKVQSDAPPVAHGNLTDETPAAAADKGWQDGNGDPHHDNH
jgi:hypothetical protein